MNTLQQQIVSEQDYLAHYSQDPDVRYEYINGEVVAMAGASNRHNMISLNLIMKLGQKLAQGSCVPFASDWRVQCDGNYYYPDIVVDCDTSSAFQAGKPILIVEILSESTRENDMTIKLLDYQKISSLQEYVLIEQNFTRVVVYRRRQNWQAVEYFAENDEIELESIDLTLSMADVYHRVPFERKIRVIRQNKNT